MGDPKDQSPVHSWNEGQKGVHQVCLPAMHQVPLGSRGQIVPKWHLDGQLAGTDFFNTRARRDAQKRFPFQRQRIWVDSGWSGGRESRDSAPPAQGWALEKRTGMMRHGDQRQMGTSFSRCCVRLLLYNSATSCNNGGGVKFGVGNRKKQQQQATSRGSSNKQKQHHHQQQQPGAAR